MSDIHELPLFGGPLAGPPSASKTKRSKAKPAPRPAHAGPRIVALPLARNRRLIADLANQYWLTPPGLNRAAAFRHDVLMPLLTERIPLGLTAEQVTAELYAIEEAIVTVLVAREGHRDNRGGPGGAAA